MVKELLTTAAAVAVGYLVATIIAKKFNLGSWEQDWEED